MTQTFAWDSVVVGGAYTDYTVCGPKLPVPGETIQGDEFLIVPGGKASNQAVEAARLGARVTLIARVGADTRGDEIVAQLKDERVDTRYIVRDNTQSTGISLIQVDQHGQKQMLVAIGASHALTVDDVHNAVEAIRDTKILLTQLEVPLEVAETAIRLGHEAGARIVFDPSPAVPLPDDLLHMVDVIKPDASEAQAITGVHVEDRNSARTAAEQLIKRGAKAVAVQAGEQGNLLLWHDGDLWLPKIPVKSIDATGAGDAFIAALAVALSEGRSLAEAGPFANAAAALTTTKLGARPSLPHREEVIKLLAKTAKDYEQQ